MTYFSGSDPQNISILRLNSYLCNLEVTSATLRTDGIRVAAVLLRNRKERATGHISNVKVNSACRPGRLFNNSLRDDYRG